MKISVVSVVVTWLLFCFVLFVFPFSACLDPGTVTRIYISPKAPLPPQKGDTVAHWLEHWTHDRKVVGTMIP